MIREEKYYRPKDEELRTIAAVQTLAKWRSEDAGPAYHMAGRTVLYLGADILDWLSDKRIEPSRRQQA